MSELEPVGQTQEIRHYKTEKTQKYKSHSPSGKLLKNPPVVIPQEMPRTTMRRIFQESNLSESADYRTIITLLTTYQRQGDNRRWDEFRHKIPDPLLKIWGDILIECRCNGFVAPRAENGEIIWRQIYSTTDIKNGDLCTLCDRECKRREKVDSGEMKRLRLLDSTIQEPKPCWGG